MQGIRNYLQTNMHFFVNWTLFGYYEFTKFYIIRKSQFNDEDRSLLNAQFEIFSLINQYGRNIIKNT